MSDLTAPVIRTLTLPNGDKITSVRESTIQAGIKAANKALEEALEEASWTTAHLEADRKIRLEQDTCGACTDCQEDTCPCALLGLLP